MTQTQRGGRGWSRAGFLNYLFLFDRSSVEIKTLRRGHRAFFCGIRIFTFSFLHLQCGFFFVAVPVSLSVSPLPLTPAGGADQPGRPGLGGSWGGSDVRQAVVIGYHTDVQGRRSCPTPVNAAVG